MEYITAEYLPKIPGKWGGYCMSAHPPIGKHLGTIHPTGKDGKGIEIKADANKSITP